MCLLWQIQFFSFYLHPISRNEVFCIMSCMIFLERYNVFFITNSTIYFGKLLTLVMNSQTGSCHTGFFTENSSSSLIEFYYAVNEKNMP